jgi:hypothetical protein
MVHVAQGQNPSRKAEAGCTAHEGRVDEGQEHVAREARRRGGARTPARVTMTDPKALRLDQLRVEARYHRQRAELYRARIHGGRAVNLARLEELERASDRAAERLRQASVE